MFSGIRILNEAINKIIPKLSNASEKTVLNGLTDVIESEMKKTRTAVKKSMLPRKYVGGYHFDDVDVGISNYLDSVVNDVNRNKWIALGTNIFNDIPINPDVKTKLNSFIISQIKNNDTYENIAANLSYLTSAYYLWGKVSTPVMNWLSGITGTIDSLAAMPKDIKIGVLQGQSELMKSFIAVNKMYLSYANGKYIQGVKDLDSLMNKAIKTGGLSKEEGLIMKMAMRDGIISDPMTREFRDEVTRIRGKTSRVKKVLDIGFKPMAETEILARGTTMLTTYRLLRKNGKKIVDAYDMAHKAVEEAHAIYGKRGKLFIETSPHQITRASVKSLLTLSRWTSNKTNMYVKILNNMKQKKAIDNAQYHLMMNMVWMMGLGGVGAIGLGPLNVSNSLEAAKNVMGFFGQTSLPKSLDLERAKENSSLTNTMFTRGVPAALAGIDFSGTMNVMLPDPFKGGVIGSMLSDIGTGIGFGLKGRVRRGIERVSPGILKPAQQAFREYTEGVTTTSGIPVVTKKGKLLRPDLVESIIRGTTGIRGISEKTRATERSFRIQEIRDRWSVKKDRYVFKIRKLLKDNRGSDAFKLQNKFNKMIMNAEKDQGFKISGRININRLKKKIVQE